MSEHTKSTLLPCVCTQGTLLYYVWVRNQIDNSSSGGRPSLAPHAAGSCPNKEGSLLDDVRTYYNYEGVAVCVCSMYTCFLFILHGSSESVRILTSCCLQGISDRSLFIILATWLNLIKQVADSCETNHDIG